MIHIHSNCFLGYFTLQAARLWANVYLPCLPLPTALQAGLVPLTSSATQTQSGAPPGPRDGTGTVSSVNRAAAPCSIHLTNGISQWSQDTWLLGWLCHYMHDLEQVFLPLRATGGHLSDERAGAAWAPCS